MNLETNAPTPTLTKRQSSHENMQYDRYGRGRLRPDCECTYCQIKMPGLEYELGQNTCLRLQPKPICSCLQKCYECKKTGLCNEMHLITDNYLDITRKKLMKVFLCEMCNRKHVSSICDR